MTTAPETGETVPLFLPLLRNGIDPVPDIGVLRARRPVARVEVDDDAPPVWLVTGYAEVRAVLGDAEHFSNDLGFLSGTGLEALAAQDPGGLGFTDPPGHTRIRRLLSPEFSVPRLRELAARIDAVIALRLDAMAELGPPVDLVAEFAVPVPSLVICELLGVPESDRAECQRRSVERFDVLGSVGESLAAVHGSLAYLSDLVAQQRVNPGPGLLGRLLREHGGVLSDADLAALADGLLTGGHETTASMLALGALTLVVNPALADGVRSGGMAIGPVVEELLRHLSVVQVAFPRFARVETMVGGVRIGAGDVVLCSLSAANRDAVFGATEGIEPDRAMPPHLALGHGIHRCVGAELGRMELRAALPALLRRFPGLQPVPALSDVEFRAYSLVHGVRSLPVTW